MNNFTIPRNTKGSGGGDRGRPNNSSDGTANGGPGPGPGRGGDNNFTVPRRSSGGGGVGGGGGSRSPHAHPNQPIARHGHGGGGGPGRYPPVGPGPGPSNDRDRDRHRGGGGGQYGPNDRGGSGGPPPHDRHRFPPIQGDQRQQHHQQNQRQPHHGNHHFNGDRRPSSHHDRDRDRDRHGRPGELHRERSSSCRDRDRDRDGFARQGSLSRTSSQGDRLAERGGSSRNSPTSGSGAVSPVPSTFPRPYDIEVASEDPFKVKITTSSSHKAMSKSPPLLALFPRPTTSGRSTAAAGATIPRKSQNKRKLMSDDDDDEDGALHDSSSSDDGGAARGGGGDDSFFPTVSGATKTNKRIKISSSKTSDSTAATDKPATNTTKSGTGRGGGRLKRAKKASLNDDSEDDEVLKELLAPVEEDPSDVVDDPNAIDAPPPGELASLWYSREQFLHVWAIEKILAWKLRPKPVLPKTPLELETSLKLHEAALTACADNAPKRMEISRIHALNCPVVTEMALDMLDVDTVEEGEEEEAPALPPAVTAREECYLIKWRGRSYRHCSWERYADLVKFDPSNNSAAKSKINRYGQSQEVAFGKHWKQVLEDSRREEASALSSTPEGPGSTAVDNDSTAVVAATAAAALAAPSPEEEENFPPDYLEVERIVGCDEGEIDMTVFAKQRSVNLEEEMKEEEAAAEESCEYKRRTQQTKQRLDAAMHKVKDCLVTGKDPDWDPEDYVQYAVKWKALTLNEITFEYWKDLKVDYIELAEDFWHRQKVPSDENIVAKPHPELQQFQKMNESPTFGVSHTPRPVYDFVKKALVDPAMETKEADDDDDEDEKLKQAQALHLRSYQLEGVNWLLWNWWNKRSCILADEMGLGKTIQTVGFLNQLMCMDATKIRGPFLVVAPLSLIAQWQSEAAVWAPDFNVIVYHGSANARSYLVNNEFYYGEPFVNKTTAQKLRRNNVTKFHIMITTYEVVMKDIEVFQKMKWRAIVVDEAHRLKNSKSRLFADLAAVPRDFCLLLTGTPLQNSTEELWALLNFADPIHFESRDSFIDKFGQLSDAKQVSDLHSILKPYLLRRVKEDVAKSLPPKVETILEVSLTPLQKTFYKAIYERNTSHLFKGAKPSNSPSLMNIMMELRKCCNHPFLIRGAEEKIVGEAATAAVAAAKAAGGSEEDVDMIQLTVEQLVKSSGKMVLLEKLLPKLFDGGHKVLIFSQMVRTLDILNDFLRIKGYSLERLDGSTSATARNAAVNRFNRKSLNRFVMLLSTRAGGLGLNLTAADTIIIFDSDWNPQNDLQAMARAHRIGQTRAVSVYRLLTAKTYEMHMFHSASMKLGLDRAMLAQQRQTEQADEASGDVDSSKNNKSNRAMEREKQAKEIDELLKKGAYDVFRDDDDKEAKEFMETDIDALLERSTKTVTYGSTSNNMSSGLGSFSKASFVATTGEGEDKDIDLDDPDFWKKAVGLDVPAEVDDETAALVQAYADKKRVRKQIINYGADPYAEYMELERKEKEKLKQKAKAEREEKEKHRSEKKKKGSVDKDGKKSKSGDGKSSSSKSVNSPNASSDKKKSTSEREAKETSGIIRCVCWSA
jgi:SNF2 family DNA or RNA helicase